MATITIRFRKRRRTAVADCDAACGCDTCSGVHPHDEGLPGVEDAIVGDVLEGAVNRYRARFGSRALPPQMDAVPEGAESIAAKLLMDAVAAGAAVDTIEWAKRVIPPNRKQ